MKTNNKILFLLFAVIAYRELNAQSFRQFSTYNTNDTNFFQITSNFYQNYPGYGEDTSESADFLQFKRWENFWAPRLGKAGSFKIAAQATQNYVNNYNTNSKLSSIVISNPPLSISTLQFSTPLLSVPVMILTGSGNVGVGCAKPQYKLDVNGTARAKEFRVNLTGCDFVLDENYPLQELKKRKRETLKQKHLKHLFPAKGKVEISMNALLEGLWITGEEHELYLYQFDERMDKQDNEITKLKNENTQLKSELQNLKKEIEELKKK